MEERTMQKNMSFTTSIMVIVMMTIAALSAFASSEHAQGKARVVAHTAEEVSAALAQGCTIVRETRGITALVCPEATATALGLQEDIRVYKMDSGANTQIKADLVHSAGNTGAGRKVAILDTGYNYNHPELASSYLGGKDFVNDDNDPLDDEGHGSHVAGIVTADGVVAKAKGVAPGVSVLVAKVLDNVGSGYFSDVAAAIYWVVDGPDGVAASGDEVGVDAISLSLGTSSPYVYKSTCDSALPDLTAAIKYAKDNGVVVAVAAGNSGNPGVSIPGCISYSTTVGAVDKLDKVASFSGRGSALDIVAPGVSIYSTVLGTSYATYSGTSMATPMITGTIALIKTAHPTYTPAQVETALFSTAKDLGKAGKDTTYGWGRVNAQGASA
jgi:subtilisin family serine protease